MDRQGECLPRGWLWGVALALVLLRTLWVSQVPAPPAPGDPVQLLRTAAAPARLQGRLLADPRPSGDQGACRALLQLPEGRTELRFARCPQLQEGWRLEVEGQLRRPEPAPSPRCCAPC